jgi:hypothetical protein
MGRSSKTEEEALFTAIMKLSYEHHHDYFAHICNLSDKLTGTKYSNSRNTYDYITKKDKNYDK